MLMSHLEKKTIWVRGALTVDVGFCSCRVIRSYSPTLHLCSCKIVSNTSAEMLQECRLHKFCRSVACMVLVTLRSTCFFAMSTKHI